MISRKMLLTIEYINLSMYISEFRLGQRLDILRVKNISLLHDNTPPAELNGIRIQRLKNELGTMSLPTAKLELKGARGWLIGTEGQGVREI